MANPTSNFGWQMPTPTDLVTDLPADFEVFGQAVDTSLADLKGGTSGQILAKNSNTDMDFVWITNDQGDITAVTAGTGLTGGGTSGAVTLALDSAAVIAPTIFDAKGDLLAATADNTPARLAVGTNNQVLIADSTAATGMKWGAVPGATYTYTSWTPTLTNITLGNGTINAKYVQIGKLVHATISFTWGSTTSSSGTWYFSFPVTCATSGSTYIGTCRMLDAGTANYPGMILVENSTSFVPLAQYAANTWAETQNVSTTTPFTWTTNDNMSASFIYEAV